MRAPYPNDLITVWRERARTLERFGDPHCARLWALASDELARAIDVQAESHVTLREASERTGYSIDHLGALLKHGKIPNAGRKGAPRIRVTDLPAPKRPEGPGRPTRPRLVPRADAVRRLAHSTTEDTRE